MVKTQAPILVPGTKLARDRQALASASCAMSSTLVQPRHSLLARAHTYGISATS
jgi:hypothetical protein